ncbi:hypothetical protein FHS61_002691 [Altererythrobacter atlanticus]|uniref:Uncharacterized protein n=1 Tax=Croceibacterium atlanticum TaxID=1267766 RepID=A0A0F7KXH3_9SPHN|nr:hypothetical protein [Croceibacterium atlanticum]AKH43902.1 hypothetical protein WYH_02875 [Croceibacterium atlanticum]MBB5733648.1 hypothetical protein [Croceibacterium atlanticum]
MGCRLLGAALAVPSLLAAMPPAAMAQERASEIAQSWQAPRTGWGDPDLRGKWPVDYLGQTPRERPPEFGNRRYLTEEEYQAALQRGQAQLDRYDAEQEAGTMGMGHWAERGLPLRQTSMIVEPENGRYPPLTEEGKRLKAAERTSWNTEVFDRMEDFGLFDRCISRGMPSSMLPGNYNGGIEIFQAPGLVAISLEMIHETRLIYLDGRDPPPPEVTDYLGYSRGHWEGDTLVIETTNFTPGASAGPAPNSGQLHIVEHLTPVGPDEIHYEAWVEDPVVMVGRYKIDIPWQRDDDYGMFEYACHEGNVQIRGYITSTSPRFAAMREANWAETAEEGPSE